MAVGSKNMRLSYRWSSGLVVMAIALSGALELHFGISKNRDLVGWDSCRLWEQIS